MEQSSKLRSDHVQDDHRSSSAQAQMLLTALRNVIIPLVQTAVPDRPGLHDIPLGPEAEDFLAALQKYVSSVVRDWSHSDSQEGITRTVDLEEIRSPTTVNSPAQEAKKFSMGMQDTAQDQVPPGARASQPIRQGSGSFSMLTSEEDDRFNWMLQTLRTQVFNEMPIRLLRFDKHGSDLSITLLDRTGIYSHLAALLMDKFSSQKGMPDIRATAAYAILSHTWLRSAGGEVTYDGWHQGGFDLSDPGYRKLVNFCRVATEDHGLTLGWMDTVCINKESSSELDESIRSMYKWYEKARICIAYLSETTAISDMAEDAWFTRGWTLQELLAPNRIKFYAKNWRALRKDVVNDTDDLKITKVIQLATTITSNELISSSLTPISRKMQWAAKREVTREEDSAYSLMGIFNVNMSIAYGEGAQRAFIRLVKEILSTTKSDVLDLFNWAGERNANISSLIPSRPHAYLQRCALNLQRTTLMEPLTLTHLGLRVPVLLLPAAPVRTHLSYISFGDYYAESIQIEAAFFMNFPGLPNFYNILDAKAFTEALRYEDRLCRIAFAVLNFGGDESSITLSNNDCLAVALLFDIDVGIATPLGYKRRIPTTRPITFRLEDRNNVAPEPHDITIQSSQLARHGMQFLTMYL
ncbi:hypothetical protein BJ912DRAFT_1059915 [Pholiota molesta]|nr:hypothetical protein BJ912DRAFT_1059915 [Pholiota molesta]